MATTFDVVNDTETTLFFVRLPPHNSYGTQFLHMDPKYQGTLNCQIGTKYHFQLEMGPDTGDGIDQESSQKLTAS